jgi:hypothetical protein
MRQWSGVLAVLLFARASVWEAHAAEIPPEAVSEDEALPAPSRPFVPALARPPGLGAALEGYAGIALLMGPGATRSRSLIGGLLRFRYRYFQLAGVAEVTDTGQAAALNEQLEESWRSLGVLAGAWLPFDRWIDVDAAIGYVDRRFYNPDRIYGPRGMNTGGPAIAWRFGISDRYGEKKLGARLGAALLGTIDLQSQSAPFERRYLLFGGGESVTRGTTDVGGVSIALVVQGGLELGGGARSNVAD